MERVAIVVPIYKSMLMPEEKASLKQLRRVLGTYPCFFIAPRSLTIDFGALSAEVGVERFDDHYFTSTTSYSCLLLEEEFYSRFQTYEYILIYQLDAVVFQDRLQEFCNMGYDYIGAPVSRFMTPWHTIRASVGNGGLSLRKVATALRMIRTFSQWGEHSIYRDIFTRWEDLFWGYCGAQAVLDFKVPDRKSALDFAVQEDVQHAYSHMLDGWRPFGCHGWMKMDESIRRLVAAEIGYAGDFESKDVQADCLSLRKSFILAARDMHLSLLWGCILRGEYIAGVNFLVNLLHQYDIGDICWQWKAEDFSFLWRICWEEIPNDDMIKKIILQLLEEAIYRSMKSGWNKAIVPSLLEAIIPLMAVENGGAVDRLSSLVYQIRKTDWEKKICFMPKSISKGKSIRIVVITVTKNEMDVIESFVRHTLSFADELLVIDQHSTDDTVKILDQLVEEGLSIKVICGYKEGYACKGYMNRLLELAIQEDCADIVIPLSADEFLIPRYKSVRIRVLLEQLKPNIIYGLPRRLYTLFHPEWESDEFLLGYPLLRESHDDAGQSVIIGAQSASAMTLRTSQDARTVYVEHDNTHKVCSVERLQDLSIACFRYRNPEQFALKTIDTWSDVAAEYSVNSLTGIDYKLHYQHIMHEQQLSEHLALQKPELINLSPYVEKQNLRYSCNLTIKPLDNLMRKTIQLSQQIAETEVMYRHSYVTVLLPYFGNDMEFSQRQKIVEAQIYPWIKVIAVLVPSSTMKSEWPGISQVIQMYDSQLLSAAIDTKYVQWLFPGCFWHPDFLQKMVTCIELQDFDITMLIDAGNGMCEDSTPYMDFCPQEDARLLEGADLWKMLLQRGKYPSGSLSAVLMRREVMDGAKWLADCFSDEGCLEYIAWRNLLCSQANGERLVAFVPHCYFDLIAPQNSLEEQVLLQQQWLMALEQDQPLLDEDAYKKVRYQAMTRGQQILEEAVYRQVDTQTDLWKEYQDLLIELMK